jgi:hypothetical protein
MTRNMQAGQWKEEWVFARFLLSWLRRREIARRNSQDPFIQQPAKDTLLEGDTYDDFRQQLKEGEKFYPPLRSMLSVFSK